MDTFVLDLGDFFDVDGTARRIECQPRSGPKGSQPSLINRGSVAVYFGWNKADVTADDTEESNKGYLEPGEACRIPSNCTFFSAKTASGAGKIQALAE